MKKQVSILLQVTIAIYIICCGITAYHFFQVNTSPTRVQASKTAVQPVQFEVTDGTESSVADPEADIPAMLPSSSFHVSLVHKIGGFIISSTHVKNEDYIIQPLYISNRVLLI
jgi:hypothetical protein